MAELEDFYITLRAVTAPMTAEFAKTGAAGEEMAGAVRASVAEMDTAVQAAAGAFGEVSAAAQRMAASVTESAGAVSRADAAVAASAEGMAATTAASARETAAADAEMAAAGDKLIATSRKQAEAADAAALQWNADMARMREATVTASLDMEAAQVKAAASTEAMSAKMGAAAAKAPVFGAGYDAMAGRLLKVGAAGLVAAGATVKMAADFQTSTNKLVTSAGETDKNIDMVRQGLLTMAGQVGVSAKDLATAMYTVESAGYHAGEGLGVLKAAEQGAKAEGADATTVADALSSAMRDYYPNAHGAAEVTKDAAAMMSKFIGATSAGKMTFDQLAGALASVLPIASGAHIKVNDLLGSLAAMTVHGMSAQRATQNMADAIRHLQGPTGVMKKELAALGINSTELSANLGKKGLTGTIQEIADAIHTRMGGDATKVVINLQDALKGLPPAVQDLGKKVLDGSMSMKDFSKAARDQNVLNSKQVASFSTLAGSFHTIGTESKSGAEVYQTYAGAMQKAMGDASGLNVALMLSGQNADYANKAIGQVSKSTADASGNVKGWSEVQGSFNQKLSQAKDGAQALGIAVGEKLLPAASKILGVFASVAGWFGRNKVAATALAIAIGILLVGGVVGVTMKLASFAASMATNFVRPITGSIGLVKNFANTAEGTGGGSLRTFGSRLLEVGKSVGTFAGGLLRALIPAVISAATATWSFTAALLANPITWIVVGIVALVAAIVLLVTHWKQVEAFLRTVWNAFIGWAKGLWNAFAGFFKGLWNDITGFLRSVWNGIVDFGKGLWNGFVNFWKTVWNGLASFLRGLWNSITGAIHAAWNAIIGFIQAIPSRIIGFFRSAGQWLLNLGGDIIRGLWNGISNALGWLWDRIRDVGNGIKNAFQSVLSIFSPSKVMADEVGAHIPTGIAQGMLANIGHVTNAAKTISAAVVGSFTGAQLGINVGANVTGPGGIGGLGPAGAGVGAPTVALTINVAGSAVTDRDLIQTIQTGLLKLGVRNVSTGLTYQR